MQTNRSHPARVVAVLGAALVGSVLTVPAAGAATEPAPRSEADGLFTALLRGPGAAGCTLDSPRPMPPKAKAPGAGQEVAYAGFVDRVVSVGTRPVLAIKTGAYGTINPTLRHGGLSGFTATGSGELTFQPLLARSCSASTGAMAQGLARLDLSTIQPIAGAGWLTVNFTQQAPNPGTLSVVTWDHRGRQVTRHSGLKVPAHRRLRVHLPARGTVWVVGTAMSYSSVSAPLPATTTLPFELTMRGVVTPVESCTRRAAGQPGRAGRGHPAEAGHL